MMKKEEKLSRKGLWRSFFHTLPQLKIPWMLVFLAFCVNLAFSRIELLLPTTTAELANGSLEIKALMNAIFFYVSYAVLITALYVLLNIVKNLSIRNARNVLWNRMLRIRMDYYDTRNPSDLMSALTNDLPTALDMFLSIAISLLPDIYFIYGALSEISSYHIGLLLSVFALVPVKFLYMYFIGKWQYKTQAGIFNEIGGLTAFLSERIRRLALIKTYTNEKQELNNGKETAKKLYSANMREIKLQCTDSAISTLIGIMESLIPMVLAVILLQKGTINITQWIAFFMFSSTLSTHFSSILYDWIKIKALQGALSRSAVILEAPLEKNTASLDQLKGTDITFENVTFSYDDKTALQNVTFYVPEGSHTAIVGLCGSGKTTSISLIQRFYDPIKGEICIGGVPVKNYALKNLRSSFSYVQQGAEFFGGTLREALCYGINREITDEEIMNAAEKIGFSDFIDNQPEKLDTKVASEGSSLSGGQKQRLALTREFMRNADILLLDEPTSALDAKAANDVRKAIFSRFENKTTIIVTHDLKLLAGMDQIIVLNGGVLAGCGTFSQLMKSCKVFKEMIATQEQEVTI